MVSAGSKTLKLRPAPTPWSSITVATPVRLTRTRPTLLDWPKHWTMPSGKALAMKTWSVG